MHLDLVIIIESVNVTDDYYSYFFTTSRFYRPRFC